MGRFPQKVEGYEATLMSLLNARAARLEGDKPDFVVLFQLKLVAVNIVQSLMEKKCYLVDNIVSVVFGMQLMISEG